MPTSIVEHGDLLWHLLTGVLGLLIALTCYTVRNLITEVKLLRSRVDKIEQELPKCRQCAAGELEKSIGRLIESIKTITENQKELRDRLPKEYLRVEFYAEIKEDIKEIKETIKEIFIQLNQYLRGKREKT